MSLSERVRSFANRQLRDRSVNSLVRASCWVALGGLAVMSASIVHPLPLLVIFAMSFGHVIGIVAFLLYLLSILLDVVRTAPPSDAPGDAQKIRPPDARSARSDERSTGRRRSNGR